MVVLGGGLFLISEVPLHNSHVSHTRRGKERTIRTLQGYLAHKKQPNPLGPPSGPSHRPTVGSQGGAVCHERSSPVRMSLSV